MTNYFKLIQFIDKKIDVLKSYFSITEFLSSNLDFNNSIEIIQLLNKRNEHIKIIENIEKKIKEFNLDKIPKELATEINEKKGYLNELFKKIESKDKECLEKLNQRLNFLKKEISEHNRSVRVAKFYSNISIHQPRFLDIRK
ncbi:MAG: hypothetical protein ACUVQP_02365 [Bacteroidales bacterium]